MDKKFIESNIVLIGSFKPTIFDKLFFIKNNLFSEDDFLENSIFTPEFSQLNTKQVTININKNQIVIINKSNGNIKLIAEKIIDGDNGDINAIGYNFKWFLFLENIDQRQYTKSLFYAENNNVINDFFNTPDVVYGYYVSKNIDNARVKLDIKPASMNNVETNETKDILMFNFNFHMDEHDKKLLLNNLSKYSDYEQKAKEILIGYE